MNTLIRSGLFDKIFIFCSSPRLLDYLPVGVEWLPRPPRLDGDAIKANELFQYAVESVPQEFRYVFLTQVTSPFLSEDSLSRAIEALTIEDYESIFSVRAHRTYAWIEGQPEPLNYSLEDIPRTQDLAPIYLETSGFYGFRRESYLGSGMRVSGRHKKIELGFAEAIDIDYPEDFVVAENLLKTTDRLRPEVGSGSADQRLSLLRSDFKQQKIKHIVFDFDGVLIDSLPSMSIAWRDASSALGLDIPFARYKEALGLPFSDICSSIGVSSELAPRLAELYFGHEEYGGFRTYDGVVESINRLLGNGIVLSILTSKPRASARKALDKLPFSARVLLCSPEDIKSGRGKPAPDGLLEVVSAQGTDPVETVFVGDMQVDRETARRAGITFFMPLGDTDRVSLKTGQASVQLPTSLMNVSELDPHLPDTLVSTCFIKVL